MTDADDADVLTQAEIDTLIFAGQRLINQLGLLAPDPLVSAVAKLRGESPVVQDSEKGDSHE